MNLNRIINRVNDLLAGEMLDYAEVETFLDRAVDDLNTALNANYPVFSEFTAANYGQYPDYDFFPDKYIRTVVCLGAAFYFYVTDEEGMVTANKYDYLYRDSLYSMIRDYSSLVPDEFQSEASGDLISDQKVLGETLGDVTVLFEF